jgi:hypothetical protein
MKSHKIWDGVYAYSPHLYWLWNWTWHQALDFFSDFSDFIDLFVSTRTGENTMVLAYHLGLGDGVVEKSSAHAEGVAGKIRRSEFRLEHFNIKANDEAETLHEAPNGQHVKVNPWQLLFVELGLPFDQVRGCAN